MGSIGRTANPTGPPAGDVGGIVFQEFTNTQFNTLNNIPRTIRFADITDGASNTAVWAEIRRGNSAGSGTPVDPQDVRAVGGMTAAQDLTPPPACNSMTGTAYRYPGLEYYRSFVVTSFYSHTQTPNSLSGDCSDLTSGHITARSYHTSGVNVGFCDGSVRFITDSIALNTWQLLGSRSDGMPVTPP
jgi:prepilin-type processing-associated H-X9-DG protein